MSANDGDQEQGRTKRDGELANEILKDLTIVEEALDQVNRGNEIHAEDLAGAIAGVSNAQQKAAELLDRDERREGSI